MSFIDNAMWIAGLSAETILLVLLFRRRLVYHVPVFTTLIAFYLIRAGVLFGSYSLLSRYAYDNLSTALSAIDLVLEILVAAEIAFKIIRRGNGGPMPHGTRRIAILIAGTALALITASLMPMRGPVPVDRGMVFMTVLATLLAVWMALVRLRGLPRDVAVGFAFYGIAGIFAAYDRSFAILHRSRAAFVAASYVQTGAYLCIVVFWIVTLLSDRPRSDQLVLAA